MLKLNRVITLVLVPLFIGGLIYVLFRDETLYMFRWFRFLGIMGILSQFRHIAISNVCPPEWVIFNMPDALWVFSFTNLMLILWQKKSTDHSFFWIILPPAIGVCSEIGQLAGLVNGTFDLLDLVFIFIFIAIILSFTLNATSKSKHSYEIK